MGTPTATAPGMASPTSPEAIAAFTRAYEDAMSAGIGFLMLYAPTDPFRLTPRERWYWKYRAERLRRQGKPDYAPIRARHLPASSVYK